MINSNIFNIVACIFYIQHFKNTFAADHPHLYHVELIGNNPQWPEDLVKKQDECNEFARINTPVGNPPNQQPCANGKHNFHNGKKNRVCKRDAENFIE